MTTNSILENELVSICCLSYKHGYFIKDCLESICSQTYRNIEIIVLDDGSPDNSLEILREYSKNSLLPIKIIEQNNSGNIAENFNILIRNAKGQFISFVSMDDYLEQDCILSKITLFKKDNNLAFVGSKYFNLVDQNSKINKRNEAVVNWVNEKYNTAQELIELEFEKMGSFTLQGCLFRKDIIDEIGGFDNDLLGDDIILRTKMLKYLIKNPHLTFILEDSVSVNYRIHDNNIHKNSFRQINIINEWMERYFENRIYPNLFFSWIHGALISELKKRNFNNFLQLVDILQLALKKEGNKLGDKYYKIVFKKDIQELNSSTVLFSIISMIKYLKKIIYFSIVVISSKINAIK